jgi:hypothetical protein
MRIDIELTSREIADLVAAHVDGGTMATLLTERFGTLSYEGDPFTPEDKIVIQYEETEQKENTNA